MPQYDETKLLTSLKEIGVIDAAKLDQIFEQSKRAQISFEAALIKSNLITDKNLGQTVAEILNTPFVHLADETLDDSVVTMLPASYAKKHLIIPYKLENGNVLLATNNPQNSLLLSLVKQKLDSNIQVKYATQLDLENTFSIYKKDLQTVFNEMMEGLNYKSINKAEGETSIANIVDLFIEYAYETKASDIHIEPYENISQVRFRLDGVLHDQVQIPKDVHENVVSRIKVLSKLRTDEHLSAQDGKLRRKMEYEDLDIRVSILPLVEGEKCVLRLLASHGKDFSLSELGMDEQSLEKITKAYSNPHGMILTTGPTGSGKTTTNYAVLKMLNKREVNITTIEDPVEFDIEGVNQIQVNQKTNLTFAAGLKSILRQDPDIVLVGEIRDAETAGIAINAAMTGHLVLSTLHTNDAATTLPRLIDMEIEPFLVASTINIIVAQRLVRKICNKCKVSKEVPVKELEAKLPKNLTKKHFGKKKTLTIYEGKGCAVCNHTGYSGRLGIFELLEITPEIRELVMQKANADVLREAAIKEGMITMLEDGIKKIASGATTAAEVLRVTRTEA